MMRAFGERKKIFLSGCQLKEFYMSDTCRMLLFIRIKAKIFLLD